MAEDPRGPALDQVANVARLPGIVEASIAMPDIHWGYGFPIGGVAATDVDAGGVVSPGGVGFDICCGVRLLASDLTAEDSRVGNDPSWTSSTAGFLAAWAKGPLRPELCSPGFSATARAVLDAGYG